jgi:uncharacterized protein (TIGR04255 family)
VPSPVRGIARTPTATRILLTLFQPPVVYERREHVICFESRTIGATPRLSDGLPNKLKHDAIIEATFEIRFDAEPSLVAEVLFGRLADTPDWRAFIQRRLPTADIPAALRRADPNLRFLPAIELIHPEGTQIVRMGPQSLTYTRRAPYPGWDVSFGTEIERVVDVLFKVVPHISVSRLGLRYINALRSDLHGINGVDKLNLNITVDAETLTRNLNLNYTVPVLDDSSCTVRIATKDFAQGSIPETTTVIADLDVFTNEPYQTAEIGKVKDWKEAAHVAEKENFFRLLRAETIKSLRED